MRWQGSRESGNVEDRRGIHPGIIGGGVGTVVLAIVAMLFGVDPRDVLQGGSPADQPAAATAPQSAASDTMRQFVGAVLGSTEDVWGQVFRQRGGDYRDPTLVLYDGAAQSACGFAQAAVGPFYCPEDEKVYLDLSFFRELRDRFGASGDFAEAYVIAHEVGHHVQKLLGIEERVHQAMDGAGKAEANALSVRLELQADCFAGVWGNLANRQRHWMEPGDAQEALTAASSIGDDKLQEESRGYVVPESFTHGTSAQRVTWFKRGLESGDLGRCDTFAGSQ